VTPWLGRRQRAACTRRARAVGGVLLAVVSLGCHGSVDDHDAQAEGRAAAVQVRKVEAEARPALHETVGTLRARISATVAAEILATIREVRVGAGDAVRAGDVLATLDDQALRAEFERAEIDYRRFKRLLDKEAATRAEFEGAQARYRVADAALNHARIIAPFDGVVAAKFCDPGDLAAPGKALFTVDDPGAFRLETRVPERMATGVVVGQSVEVVVDATAERCGGRVSEVVQAADPASRSILVKVDLACRGPLRSGMFGRALLPSGAHTAFLVPRDAVHEQGQLTYVFVVAEERARMRLVRIGAVAADGLEVLSGLEPGELVVVAAAEPLRDGQSVEAR
jgi:RND family efflux transporter MFP subunit